MIKQSRIPGPRFLTEPDFTNLFIYSLSIQIGCNRLIDLQEYAKSIDDMVGHCEIENF